MPIIFNISRKSYKGLAEVHIRFYQGRKCDLRARTRIYVPVSAWNNKEGRCNVSRRYESKENMMARTAQMELDELAERVMEAYAKSGGCSREWLQKVIDRSTEEKPLSEIVDEYCDAKQVATRSRYKLHSLQLHIRRFDEKRRRKLFAHTITTDDLEAFVKYLRSINLGINAIASRLREIRALVYFGGKPYPNPFENFTMPKESYADPIFLTKEERDAIAGYEGLSPAKEVQRDIFIFQCHVGCRVSDLYSLTHRNIKDGWLVYSPKKTERDGGRLVEVPLSPTALDLIEKYKGMDIHGRLFPFISDIKYNVAIRYILEKAGIDRPIIWRNPKTGETKTRPMYEVASSHLARKTFAQLAYSSTGDKRLTASMTGHAENSRAFDRYSEVTREMKRKALGL